MNQPISFRELINSKPETFNDSNTFVWMALEATPEQIPDIENFLKENNFLPKNGKILEMRKITGNVLGENGRTDYLFVTEPCTFNPMARLTIQDLKWTSDFTVNAASDYGGFVALSEEENLDLDHSDSYV